MRSKPDYVEFVLLQLLLMLLLLPCLLLLIISYLVAVNKCLSEAPKADNFDVDVVVAVVVVVVVALLVVIGHIIFSCGQ